MKLNFKIFFICNLMLVFFSLNVSIAQKKNTVIKANDSTSTEYWRKKGFEARLKEQPEISIDYYKKVLVLDSNDYDAKLAVANTYFNLGDFNQALIYYNKIYRNDPLDVEALNGIGRCYLRSGNADQSVQYLREAIINLPGFITPYFDLARAYINTGNLNEAKEVYVSVLNKDSTNAEAWAGAGRMLYWQDKPKSALDYYRKALQLEPANEEIRKEYANLLNALKFWIAATFNSIYEDENVLKTKTFLQRYGITKRLNNYLSLSVNTMYDRSRRTFTYKDTSRGFDNTWARITYARSNQNLGVFAGISFIDSRVTSYGANWESIFTIFKKVKIKNNLLTSYEYFYYWNKVDRDYISDFLSLTYGKFGIDMDYRYGAVRMNYIRDFYTRDKNPFRFYTLAFKYKLLKKPVISFSLVQSLMDYETRSPLYFSPSNRVLRGITSSAYYDYKKFYAYAGYSYRFDNFGESFWTGNKIHSGEFELGYSFKTVNLSAGGSRYLDPFYKNRSLFLSLRKRI